MIPLLFAIPTWNRHQHLDVCVRSIADQIPPGSPIRILIQDDASTDATPETISKLMVDYPTLITTTRRPTRTDYADAFQQLFTHPAVPESEWVWTFGDDDKLAPGALAFMLEELAKADHVCMYHVAEATRASGTSAAHAGTLFDLCCQFGWVEMTGFITANIVRGPLLFNAGSSTFWPHYARTAFAQSCALLEVLHDEDAVFLDVPLIRSQDNSQSPETIKRWGDDQIAVRYTYLGEALEVLYRGGVLKTKVPKKFFRYLVYHLWDRFLTFMVSDYVERRQMWPVESWARVKKFGEFLADEADRDAMWRDVDICQGLIAAHAFMGQAADGMLAQALGVAQARNVEIYPYGYAAAGTGRPAVHGELTSSTSAGA